MRSGREEGMACKEGVAHSRTTLKTDDIELACLRALQTDSTDSASATGSENSRWQWPVLALQCVAHVRLNESLGWRSRPILFRCPAPPGLLAFHAFLCLKLRGEVLNMFDANIHCE